MTTPATFRENTAAAARTLRQAIPLLPADFRARVNVFARVLAAYPHSITAPQIERLTGTHLHIVLTQLDALMTAGWVERVTLGGEVRWRTTEGYRDRALVEGAEMMLLGGEEQDNG